MKLSDYENAFSAFVNSSILSPFVKKFVRWAFPRTYHDYESFILRETALVASSILFLKFAFLFDSSLGFYCLQTIDMFLRISMFVSSCSRELSKHLKDYSRSFFFQ